MSGMEAAVASGILKIVGNKLAPLLINEYSSIVGAEKDLQELKDQVMEINCWFETVGDKIMRSNPSFNWVKNLKDVAYAVDDVIDEFQLEAEKHDARGDGGTLTKYMCRKPKSLILQCKVARKLKAIKERFAAIVKQRSDFSAITNSLPVVHCHKDRTIVDTLTLPTLNEASVFGRHQEKYQIISKLVEPNQQQNINIVSVIGLGGSGKTTLAKLVFNDVIIIVKYFDVRLWVHVSQEFDFGELIKKTFESFADNDPGHHSLPYMSKRISEKLTGKRFLLVMDDVWTESPVQWEQFMLQLKSDTPGSRILLTTRNKKVAEIVGSMDQLDLSFLSEDVSWQLFQQSLRKPEKSLESEFVAVGKEIVKKCGGVPLAIKVVAGVLHDKELIEEWQALRDSNLLDVPGEGDSVSVSACLRLSYFHLPSHLKPCFTICSVFPKGHEIDKEQLIDLWIAHDMITIMPGVNSLENNGHRCFNSLVQMSFLQDLVEQNGRMSCRMHDLVHDFAQLILCDEISLVVPQEAANFKKSYRYFSLIEQPTNLLPKNIFEKARAVYVDNGDSIISGKSLKSARHLRSITVVGTSVVTTILQIKYLRYLSIPRLKCGTLPEAISDIWSLQALHAPYSNLLELPKSIGKLQRLRTLNLLRSRRLESLPDSIGDCHMISTIDLRFCASITVLPNSMERNKILRVLRLGRSGIKRLPPSITTLEHLECLDLENLLELPEGMGNLKKLEVLNLCSNVRSMPVGFGQLTRLKRLDFFVVGEGEKSAPISELGNIARISGELTIKNIAGVMVPDDAHKACLKQKTNLQSLTLEWGENDGVNVEKAVAILDGLEPPVGIQDLEIRDYAGGRFAQWITSQVGVGVQGLPQFPCLTRMHLSGFPNLKHLKGLVRLPCLEELYLADMPSLESISGGPFPSLVRLNMSQMPSLGEVWMVTCKMNLADVEDGGDCSDNCSPRHPGQVQIGTRLSVLGIYDCPKLKIKPHLPLSLEELNLDRSNEQLLLSPCQGQGPFLLSNDADSPSCFSFSRLKELRLVSYIATASSKFESGCGLGLLQHLTVLVSLQIRECHGLTQLPESIGSLTSLRSLNIGGCSALCKLPNCLGELRSLQEMRITYCKSLSSLPSSMQRLTTLQTLDIDQCFALLQLPEWLGKLCSLQNLKIAHLPIPSILPQSLQHLTSLQALRMAWCDSLHELPECLGDLRCLRYLCIMGLPGLSCLPRSLPHLSSLQEFTISDCHKLKELPECLGELRSLLSFKIRSLPGVTCLPQSLCRLTSLQRLTISYCQGLRSLPEGMQGLIALQQLEIGGCPDLTSLPEGIQDLTALQELTIWGCPGLVRRCQRGMGDWHLISHIPRVSI